jgi:N-acetylneuraminate lyase
MMNEECLFSGVYPALVSPVTADGVVMEANLRALVRHFAATRVRGVYVCGGTGEGILLPIEVRMRILEIVVDEAGALRMEQPLQVIAHIGAAEAANTRELVLHAKRVGAYAISTIPPIYFTYSRERICAYYAWVSQLTDLPLIIYAAAQAGVAFTADMLKELSAYPNIRGIKFTGYNFFELMRMRAVVPADFSILNGGDEVLLFGLLAGCNGGVGATYNVMPDLFCRLYDAFMAQDFTLAKALQQQVNEIIGLMIQYPVIGAVKWMLENQGLPVGETVFPDDPLSDAQKKQLLSQLHDMHWEEVCR